MKRLHTSANTLKKIAQALCILLFASTLAASELSDARDSGLVEELPSGFIASTAKGAALPNIVKMVEEVNAKRHDAYEKIAKQTGITVELVGQESYRKRHEEHEE